MAALQNIVFLSEPTMKQPIQFDTMMDGQSESNTALPPIEMGLRLSNEPPSAKVLPNIKSKVSPLEISQKVLEPRVLKVSKLDLQLLSIVLREGRDYIKGTITS